MSTTKAAQPSAQKFEQQCIYPLGHERELLEALKKIKRIMAAGQLEERDIQCVYSVAAAAIAKERKP